MGKDILNLMDFDKVNALLEGFNKSTGFVTAILDLEGNVLSKSGWRQICTNFHRIHPETSKKCTISDTELASRMADGEKYHFYKCLNGLVDVAVPIVVNGEHIANLFSGQFFFEKPDVSYFKKQAVKYGFDEKKYLDTLSKVPVVSEEKVKTVMDFLLNMTLMISEITFQKAKQVELNKQIIAAKDIAEESGKKYRLLTEFAADVVWVLNLTTGKFTYISPSVFQLRGLTAEEAMKESLEDVLTPESLKIVKDAITKNTKYFIEHPEENNHYINEIQQICKNGRIIWVEISTKFRFSPTGDIEVVGVSRNIDKKKKAEEDLLKSEEKFRSLIESSNDGICLHDMQGTIIFTNKRKLEMLGYKNEAQLLGTSVYDLLDDAEKLRFKEMVPHLSEKGNLTNIETEVFKQDGSTLAVELNFCVMRDENGNPRYIMDTMRDITFRKLAEDMLQESESKYRLLFESNPQPMLVYDIETLSILAVNKTMIEKYGYSEKEFLSMTILDIRPDEDVEKLLENIKNVEKGLDEAGEWRHRLKNGDIIDVEITSHVINYEGRKAEIVIASDITERKKAEEEYLKFFTITEKALFGSAIADPEGNLVYVNDYFAHIHGYTVKELLGRKLDIFHSDTQMPLIEKTIESALEKGSIEAVEILHLNKSGHEFPMLMSLAVINDSFGKPKYIAATAFDLTEHKLVQEKLQNTVNDQNVLLKNDPTLIYFKDCSNNIIRVTESVAKATGLTREEIEGRPSKEIYPDMADRYWEDDLEVIKSGKPKHNIVEPLTGVDGSNFWLLTTKVPVKNDSGDIVGICVFATDITELKNAEIELISAKEKAERNEIELIKAQEIAHIGSWYLNIETNEVVWTEELYKMYGFDPDLPPPPYTEHMKLFTTESWEILSTSLARTRETGIPYELELETIKKDKSNGWMWVRGEAVFDENNKIVGLWGAAQDITERKQVEEALRKSQNNYQNLVENTPDIIYSLNIEGQFTFVSHNISKYDFAPEEVIGHHIKEFIHPDDIDEVLYDLRKSFELEVPVKTEFRLASSDGSTIWFVDTSSKLVENDKVIGFTGIIHDITERKLAEEKLKYLTKMQSIMLRMASEFINMPHEFLDKSINIYLKELGEFVESDRAYVFEYDWINNVCNNTYEWCNEGISPEIDNLQNVPNEAIDYWVKTHKNGDVMSIEDVMQLPPEDGVRQILEPQGVKSLIALPMMKLDQCIGFVGFDSVREKQKFSEKEQTLLKVFSEMLVSIGNRRELENKLILAKEKAEESDRLKSAFLANMSHEIRTPMNGILGFADLLKQPDLTGDELQRYIEIIEKSGDRMLNIIDQIVDISKIEAGLIELSMNESNINEQIDFIHTFFKPEAENKGLKLSIEKHLAEKEALIKTDREKVYAVLTNLVKNAIKYTHSGSIKLGYTLQTANERKELRFYIKDSGIGIPKDRQEAIFERFIQADISDKMAQQGAGLGLAISKAYVEMLGGKIWVESNHDGISGSNLPEGNNTGSTFYFTLPYNTETVEEKINGHQAHSEKHKPDRKLKILIAEDDEVSELLLNEKIKIYSKEILNTRTGADTVNVCRANPDIDLILMDIRMPEMNGLEATKQIREFNKEIVIIAQTAYVLTGDREEAIEAGCNDYIAKPINKFELQAMIQKYFGK